MLVVMVVQLKSKPEATVVEVELVVALYWPPAGLYPYHLMTDCWTMEKKANAAVLSLLEAKEGWGVGKQC